MRVRMTNLANQFTEIAHQNPDKTAVFLGRNGLYLCSGTRLGQAEPTPPVDAEPLGQAPEDLALIIYTLSLIHI